MNLFVPIDNWFPAFIQQNWIGSIILEYQTRRESASQKFVYAQLRQAQNQNLPSKAPNDTFRHSPLSPSLSRWHSPPQPKIDPSIIRGHHTYPLRTHCALVGKWKRGPHERPPPSVPKHLTVSYVSPSLCLPPSSLSPSPSPSAHLHPSHSQSPNPHWRFSTRRPRPRARPRSCGAAPLTRMALICISRIHYAILPCIEQTITGQRPRGVREGGCHRRSGLIALFILMSSS